MHIEHLNLVDFRNFANLRLKLRPGPNFFIGDNGQGKTNILEAAHLLCRGSSFRPINSSSLIRWSSSAPRCKITGEFLSREHDYAVEMMVDGGRKSFAVNGKRVNATRLIQNFPLVLFSPESLASIKEGPELRRQVVDEILVNIKPMHAKLLQEYSHALKSRNRLLKSLCENVENRSQLELALGSLNKIYLILATHLTSARIEILKEIAPYFREALSFIGGQSIAEVSVDYVVSDESAMNWSESDIFDAIRKRQLTLAQREVASGISLVGPHKHDIKFLVGGNDSRFYCSQGQQRALILALKVAQIVYHYKAHQTYPVLLLDDVLSEMDLKKRINLMRFLERISAQILITTTDFTWTDQFAFDRKSIFQVTDGQIEPRSTL